LSSGRYLFKPKRIDDLDDLRRRFVAAGVWLRPFGRIVYPTPILTIGEADLRRLTDAVLGVLAQWSRRRR
jgi:adenosylmethionine-8-amino-7-oxononanoate aminotransferase